MINKNKKYNNRYAFAVDEITAIIRGLYLSLLDREPDVQGLAHWVDVWRKGADLDVIAQNLLSSEEYRIRTRGIPASINHLSTNSAVENAIGLIQSPIVIVDVGAQNLENEDHVYASLIKQKIPCRVIGFEPLDNRRCERERSDGAHLTLLPNFIGDGREHIFYINEPDSSSSLLPLNKKVTDCFWELAPLRTVATEKAVTSTLDVALKNEARIDLLKLDIQGFELTALQHAAQVLQRTLVVHCEVSFVEIYQGQALFSEVEQYMRSIGFQMVDFSSLCRYPFTDMPYSASRDWLGWGDAVFFRHLGSDADWHEKLIQSLIALVVYRKASLAAWLARDLKNTPAEKYMNTLFRSTAS